MLFCNYIFMILNTFLSFQEIEDKLSNIGFLFNQTNNYHDVFKPRELEPLTITVNSFLFEDVTEISLSKPFNSFTIFKLDDYNDGPDLSESASLDKIFEISPVSEY